MRADALLPSGSFIILQAGDKLGGKNGVKVTAISPNGVSFSSLNSKRDYQIDVGVDPISKFASFELKTILDEVEAAKQSSTPGNVPGGNMFSPGY